MHRVLLQITLPSILFYAFFPKKFLNYLELKTISFSIIILTRSKKNIIGGNIEKDQDIELSRSPMIRLLKRLHFSRGRRSMRSYTFIEKIPASRPGG